MQLSTIETSFSPFLSGLKFESTEPIDPPDNQGGGGTNAPSQPPPPPEEPQPAPGS